MPQTLTPYHNDELQNADNNIPNGASLNPQILIRLATPLSNKHAT